MSNTAAKSITGIYKNQESVKNLPRLMEPLPYASMLQQHGGKKYCHETILCMLSTFSS
jgi:hypothetical protein